MWNSECTVIPVVLGSLGAVSHKLGDNLRMIPAELCATMCQKITLLGSEKIMRSVLSRKWFVPGYAITGRKNESHESSLYGLVLPLRPNLFVQSWPLLDYIWSGLLEINTLPKTTSKTTTKKETFWNALRIRSILGYQSHTTKTV